MTATILRPCGSEAAYYRHLQYHQVPCTPCMDAKNRRIAARRRARQEQDALFRQLLDLIAAACRDEGMLP